MSIQVHREQQFSRRKRYELNTSTDDLNMHEYVRVRRIHTVTIDGEKYTQHELHKMLRAAKQCQCGKCIDCQVAYECKCNGWKQ